MSTAGGRTRTRAWAALPGAVVAFWLIALGLFLNPQLALPAAAGGAVLAAASLAGGLLSSLLLAPRYGAGRGLLRLPWTLAALLATGAGALAWHASTRAFYLPAAVNARLLVAAAWLGGIALAFFYTALLHTVHRRRYGRRSRIGLGVGLVVALTAVANRWATQRAPLFPRALPINARAADTRLLLVSLPSASLDVILPLAERGDLPFLAEAIGNGVVARLEGFEPTRAAVIEASLATGSYPFRHGRRAAAVCFAPPVGDRRGVDLLPFGLERLCPMLRDGDPAVPRRRMPALWEILSGTGVSTGVVSGPEPAPHPGPPLLFFLAGAAFSAPTPDPLPRAWPPDLLARAEDAAPPEDLPPWPGTPAAALAREGDARRLAAARALLREEVPQALWVSLPGLATVSGESFGGFLAATLAGSRNREAVAAATMLGAYYAWIDAELARLWREVSEARLLAVVSGAGTRALPMATARGMLRGRPLEGGRLDGAPDGVLLLLGPGVAPGRRLVGARVVDVMPTLLYGLGLPATRDVDGRVLTAAFTDDRLAGSPLSFVETYGSLLAGPE